jgi:hypothetical protein
MLLQKGAKLLLKTIHWRERLLKFHLVDMIE